MEKHKRLCVPKGIGAKQGGQNDTICSYFHFRPDPDIYCGRIHGTPEDFGGTGVAIRAPVQITIQGTNIHSGNQAVLLDHPDAAISISGGLDVWAAGGAAPTSRSTPLPTIPL